LTAVTANFPAVKTVLKRFNKIFISLLKAFQKIEIKHGSQFFDRLTTTYEPLVQSLVLVDVCEIGTDFSRDICPSVPLPLST
jgi:hypothetical protein